MCLALLRADSEPTLPCDYFKSLLRFRLGEAEASFALNYPFQTFDEKNGYCAEGMDHGGMGYMFAVWKKLDGKVFGFSQSSPRDGDSYDTTFWAHREGRWIELKDVTPSISLEDFWDEHQRVPPELVLHAFFEMDLPRTGTTIKVRLKGICVKDSCENGYRITREAIYNHMELNWNPRTGRFSKGTKSLTK
jgi:hypothetical protein